MKVVIALVVALCMGCASSSGSIDIEAGISTPIFPDPIGEDGTPIVTLEGDIVSMPLWYWEEVARYAIEADSAFKAIRGDK